MLTVCLADPYSRAMSFAIAGLAFLIIATGFPFLGISASGVESSMTLFEAVSYLAEYGANAIATFVFVIVILIPAAMLVAIILIAMMLSAGHYPDWMLPVTRWLFHFNAWAMVEVFAIAVIVSLVKIASMARIELGLSFWAFLGFSAMFLLAYSSLDRLTVWTAIDKMRSEP